MAGVHCEGGFWITWAEGFDAPCHVEHVATYEQAVARYRALEAAEVVSPEVSGSDGVVILHAEMLRIQMTAPKRPGRYYWHGEERGFEVLA